MDNMKRRQFIAGAIAAILSSIVKPNIKEISSALGQVPSTDDTSQLQAVLNRGGRITLEAGRRYRVSAPPGARYALLIHSDTFLDLAGATLELAPNQHYCNLISSPWDQPSRNICIANGEIVGNGSLQPSTFDAQYGISPTLYFPNSHGLVLRDLRMRDTYMYAIYARGDDGTADNVLASGAIGGGIWLEGSRWQVNRINVSNVTFFDPVNCTGNPFIVRLSDSALGDIRCENYGYGVKFQDGCENVTVNSILAIGGVNHDRYGDFLVKIQGKNDDRGQRANRALRIRSLVTRNGRGVGLYIYYSTDVSITSYLGEHNGRFSQDDMYGADVLIVDADHIHFNNLRINDYSYYGLWLHDHVEHISAGTVRIENPRAVNATPIVNRSGPTALVIGTNP